VPGEWGNVAIAGHRDTFFRPLRHIRPGDVITLRTSGGESFQYRVEWTNVVLPTDTQVLIPGNKRELTLITCFPFEYVGPAPNRFVVRAFEVASSGKESQADRRVPD
jgi:sortase A